MGPCSHALFLHLATDLSGELPSVSGSVLFDSNQKIEPWPGITTREVAALALRSSLLKKFEGTKSSKADSLALQKFLESNARCAGFVNYDRTNITDVEEIALGELQEVFYSFFYLENDRCILDVESISENIAVGPGASVGTTGDSFYHKIGASPMTGTSRSLYTLYQRMAAKYALWKDTEEQRVLHYGDFKHVQGNSLSFVPKTADISRTICTEPLLNMLFQKGIAAVFESRLRDRFGIDLTTQPDKNRMLAKIGSETGAFGTIDLSSASDSISNGLLRLLMPKEVLSWLNETRSPLVKLPDGSLLPLQMVSSMGNAFTFPLQTILFASVVIAVYRTLGIRPIYPRDGELGNFAAFGDDIICHSESYGLVVSILRRIGFLVNSDKSFNDGPFRESCGADFWHGVNVRGVYCRTLDTMQDRYSLLNRLTNWSANHAIPLPNTCDFLLKSVQFLPVPIWESEVAGVRVPFELASGVKFSDRYHGSVLYERYTPKQRSLSLLALGDRPHVARRVRHNPPGVLLSAVAGYLREGRIVLRQRNVRYLKRLAVAPCWDHYDPLLTNLTSAGWWRWVTIFTALNMRRV